MAGGVITTGSLPKLLWPGLNTLWGMSYDETEEQWKALVDQFDSKQNYEEDVQTVGVGMAPVKAEGAPIQYDSNVQGFTTRYTHVTYGLGLIITWEEIQDNLYEKYAAQRIPNLKFGFRQTKENVVANIYNRGFNSTYKGGDGVSLFSTAHPNTSGGTWSNMASVASQLSEAALENMVIQITNAEDDRGNRIGIRAMSLHIPNGLQFQAERILKSVYRVNTANNDINALRNMNSIPMGAMMNVYFTSSNAWFIRTNIPKQQGLKFWNRHSLEMFSDNDTDTLNLKAYAVERYSVGWTDPRCAYGNQGA